MVYTVDMVGTVDTRYTIQTALHYIAHSSWAGETNVAEIANMRYVVDGVEGADWADGADRGDGTEMGLMGLKWHYAWTHLSIMTAWVISSWKI